QPPPKRRPPQRRRLRDACLQRRQLPRPRVQRVVRRPAQRRVKKVRDSTAQPTHQAATPLKQLVPRVQPAARLGKRRRVKARALVTRKARPALRLQKQEQKRVHQVTRPRQSQARRRNIGFI